ncbi:MAG: hypothetical protein A3I61_08710 [Acidobacteria bacterium RIFCSPLOWO2_02_FULL_68_18]|nr:MAG: hypothetical protein A3I61_08710 [Acidobacteria bacterium RIFCSPLOWO2_02_FULL_68_18]OFW49808.1 MAG: hypothetical protein A3G77_01275 [Acidobacteria bacterium RIFCSPLOWO2_12_FULL_68_19]
MARGRWKSRGQQSGPPEGEPTPRQVDKPQPESAVSSSHNTLPSVPPAAELAAVAKLFANTADGVWVSGKEGEILFWNQAAETIMGYPAEQVVGRCCRDVFGGCDANGNRVCGWPCPIKTLLHGGDLVEHFDMATQTKTGQPLWIDVSCVAVPSADNGPPTIVHLFRDVTAAHQIELLVRQQLAQTKLKLTTSQEVLAPIGELSQRELQVITVMRTGASTAAIADQLCISKATVRNHIQNIFSKLKVHTRLEAVACVNRIARLEPTGSIDIGWAADPTKEDDKVPAEGRTRQAR